jgi:hypothetical protein
MPRLSFGRIEMGRGRQTLDDFALFLVEFGPGF